MIKDPLLRERWEDEAWPEHYELPILAHFIILHPGAMNKRPYSKAEQIGRNFSNTLNGRLGRETNIRKDEER
jgi:hypothetical protein